MLEGVAFRLGAGAECREEAFQAPVPISAGGWEGGSQENSGEARVSQLKSPE